MKNDEVKRHPTSNALVQLRKALKKTQQTFAVEVLHCAIGTVARYETSLPPEGVVLVQLADIAFQHGLTDIGNVFLMAFFDEVKSRLAKFPDLAAKDGRGYVFSPCSTDGTRSTCCSAALQSIPRFMPTTQYTGKSRTML